MRNKNHIILIGFDIGVGLASIIKAMMQTNCEIIVVDTAKKQTEDISELLKREPIPIKCFDDFATLNEPFVEYISTKPIDAIASRHKYPRKKNEW